MSGFESEEIPDWIRERFDERTRLPNGPLEHLPIPLEGQITGACSSEPSDGSPGHWNVIAACGESVEDALRFYEEYLPLAGYEITASGSVRATRSWFGRGTAPSAELILLRRGPFVGRVSLEPGDPPAATRVEAEMAHHEHECVKALVDPRNFSSSAKINWRLAP